LTIGLRLLNPSISGALGSRSNAVVTIMDQDALGSVQFSTDNFTYPENGGAATITVVRVGGSSQSLQVNFAAQTFEAVGGFDFVVTNGTFIFGPGEVSKTFAVPLLNNNFQDGDRRVALVLTDASPPGAIGFPDAAFLTIQDDESHNQPAGSLDTAFDPAGGFNGDVLVLRLQSDGKILAGGNFTAANTQIRNRLARINADGTLDIGFQNLMNGANDAVRTLSVQTDGRIVIGGLFTLVNDVIRNRIARLNLDGSLDSSFNPGSGADNSIYAIAESFLGTDRKILIGGDFVTVNSSTRNRLARLNENGTVDGSFNIGSGANGAIHAIALSPTSGMHAGKILIGGDFTSFNSVPRNRLARLNPDGSVDLEFNPGTGANDSVRAIAIQTDGRILIGGLFTNVNGANFNHVARLNPNGSLDTLFTPGVGANDAVLTIAVQGDTRILLGGQFTSASGVTRNRITRLNANGTVDPTINFGFGANSFVSAIALQTDTQIVIGGGFTEYDGEARSHLARLYGGAIGGSGAFEFTAADYQVDENGTNVLVSVRRRGGTSGAPNGDVFVTLSTSNGTAVANTHYQPVSGSLAFPPGETFENVPVMLGLQPDPGASRDRAL
jgi:uncharacterized delta-60 repeat protein